MAKPPSDAPVLFDVECDSSTIKQRKNGSYKLVMEDVERVHWETEQVDEEEIPDTEEGYCNAKRYAKNYDKYYGEDAEVSAYETFTLADGSKEKCKFTITDVKYKEKSNTRRSQISLSTTSRQPIKSKLTRSRALKVKRRPKVLCIQHNAPVGVLIGCRMGVEGT